MGEPSDSVASEDLAGLQERIEALEAENAALKAAPASDGAPSPASRERARNSGAIALVIVAAILLSLSVSAIWLNRMVTDTDWYVRTVAPLAKDPDIQNAVAASASDAVIESVDATTRLEQVLPENLQIVAAPLGSAVDEFIRKQSLNLVRSDQFAQLWEEVNRQSHAALVAAVTGRQGDVVDFTAGRLTLDVGALAEATKTRLSEAGLGVVGRLPTAAINKEIVLYDSPALAQATAAVDAVTRAAYLIPLFGLALALIALALAADRRKAVLWLGGAIAVASILPLEAVYLGQYYATSQLVKLASIPTPAAQAAFGIIFRDLIVSSRGAIAVGVVLWLGALMAGPAHWALALRTGLSGGLAGVASHLELGRFGEWVAARKRGLRAGGFVGVVLILLALPAPRTALSILWLGFAYLVWVLLVELFGAGPLEPAPDSDATAGEIQA